MYAILGTFSLIPNYISIINPSVIVKTEVGIGTEIGEKEWKDKMKKQKTMYLGIFMRSSPGCRLYPIKSLTSPNPSIEKYYGSNMINCYQPCQQTNSFFFFLLLYSMKYGANVIKMV